MKRSVAFFSTVGLFLLFSAPCFSAPGEFVASVSGTRKFQGSKGGKNVISSEAVSAKSLCAAFGVSTKDYAVVFDVNSFSLSLIPIQSAAGLPSYEILTRNTDLSDYNSASPARYLSNYTVTEGADAAGTLFEGLQGFESFTVTQTMGNPKGAVGTLSAVAVNASPDYSFFQLKISASKAFNQK